MNLSDLKNGHCNVTISGKMIDVSELTLARNGKTNYFNFIIADSKQNMRGVCYFPEIRKQLEINKTYEISNVSVMWSNFSKELELRILKTSIIKAISDLEKTSDHATLNVINKLPQKNNKETVTICGVVTNLDEIQSTSSGNTSRRSLKIRDNTGTVSLTSWTDHFPVKENDIILAEKVSINKYLNSTQLNSVRGLSRIVINGDAACFKTIRDWYKTEGLKTPSVDISVLSETPQQDDDDASFKAAIECAKRDMEEKMESIKKKFRKF